MDVTELNLNYKHLNDEQFYAKIAKYPNLISLDCACNQITNLDYLSILLPKLKKLDCTGNSFITNLDHLPVGLQELHCGYSQITSLDHLPSTLQELYCAGSNITNLDYLPSSLQILWCAANQITNLDHLPANLLILECYERKITGLDHLPNNLKKLAYFDVKTKTLDFLPSSIKEVVNGCGGAGDFPEPKNFYIKRSNYLRFLRNLVYRRKTALWLVLKSKQKESDFYEACLPDEIIKHIISFVS